MTKTPRSRVAMNALSVALLAQSQSLEAHEVIALQVRAEELLRRDDPLFAAVCQFSTMFDLHRHAPDEWPELGRELHHRLDALLTPDPPDLYRRDIHG